MRDETDSIRCGFHEVAIDSQNRIALPSVFTKNARLQRYDLVLLNVPKQKCIIICDRSQLDEAKERWHVSKAELLSGGKSLESIESMKPYKIFLNKENLDTLGVSTDVKAHRGNLCVTSLVDHIRIYHPVDWHSDHLPFSL